MKKINKLLGLGFLTSLIILSCRKIEAVPTSSIIDLGVTSKNTAIKSINQSGSTITAELATTPGAKYSVQIIPFGSDLPAKKEGFTASDYITTRVYNLSESAKKDYDFIFIDINGTESKSPIILK